MEKSRKRNLTVQQSVSSAEARIVLLRGQRVVIDSDLAELYGVKTKRLKEQVKRNSERFPADFVLQLTEKERDEVVAKCDHLKKLKFSSTLPLAFTEHGAVMAATVLNSRIAIETSILVVRAFIYAREIISEHKELKRRLELLETRVVRGFHENEEELQALRLAIQELRTLPEPKSKKPIGFGRKG